MTVAVIVNPNKVSDLRAARAKVARHAQRLGRPEPVWMETTKDDPGPGQARQALADGADVVVAWGGDGTVVAVAAELAHTGVSLGILPGGTGNLLARNLDIPLDIPGALDTIFQGTDRTIDLLDVYLGRGERQVSAVIAGTGWDAAMMAAPEEMKRRLGWGAYAVEGARRIRQKPMKLRMSIDGGPEQHLYGRTVLIANVGTLVAGVKLLPESKPDDGLLEVLVIDPSSPLDWMRTSVAIARGKGSDGDPSRTLFHGRDVIVTTGGRRPRQIDGDLVSDGHGFHVKVMPAALKVRVPT